MLKKNKSTRSQSQSQTKSRVPSQDELRTSIRQQTEKFLKLGGVIQSIPNGVSGYSGNSSTQIKISKK